MYKKLKPDTRKALEEFAQAVHKIHFIEEPQNRRFTQFKEALYKLMMHQTADIGPNSNPQLFNLYLEEFKKRITDTNFPLPKGTAGGGTN
jgi:hypothetical protein